MSAANNKAIIRRYYEEIGNQRNLAVADELFAPDFRLFPDSQPPYGPEGVKQFITWLCITNFPDLRVTIEELIAEDDKVVAHVILHATQQVTMDWLPAVEPIPVTGKPFAMPEFVIWRLEDGKIVERRVFIDFLAVVQQMGIQLVMSE